MMSEEQPQLLKLLCIITDRGKGKKVRKLLDEHEVRFHCAMLGRGTAPSDIAYYSGLGEPEKVILFTVLPPYKLRYIFRDLKEKLDFGSKGGGGLAFTVRLNSASGKDALEFFIGMMKKMEEGND